MRLYHICFNVFHREDVLEADAHEVTSYVVAECPYQALFFVRSRLNNTPWSPSSEGESWELLDPESYDERKHSPEDIDDAVCFGLVVVNIDSPERTLAISA